MSFSSPSCKGGEGEQQQACRCLFAMSCQEMSTAMLTRAEWYILRARSRSGVTLKMWIDRRIGGEIATWRKGGRHGT